MPGLDLEREFIALRIGIITVSDTRTPETDTSGATLQTMAEAAGHTIAARIIVKDDPIKLEEILNDWIKRSDLHVIISTGGTGVTGRDSTPEAFKAVLEKEIPGFGELFRMLSYQKIGASTIQSRALAGVAQGHYLFALPGSTSACRDAWDDILVHQLDIRFRPCNLVELMPRLGEQ